MHDYGAEFTAKKKEKEREYGNPLQNKKGRKVKKIKYTHMNMTSASPYLEYLPNMVVIKYIVFLD